MNKVGILGGTFDPIHAGHLITARAVKEIRNLDKIFFIPNYISPFKQKVNTSDAKHRLKMIELAIKNIPYFEVSDLEIKNEDVSYTIDTLKYFKKKIKHLELIIGYDNIGDFSKWKDADEILKIAKLIVLNRKIYGEKVKRDKYFNSAIFVDTPFIEISGTVIRQRVMNNLPIDFLVPEKVKEYICKHNLYKESN